MRYFSFQIHITDNCDQRCKHCYIFSGSKTHKLISMSPENFQKVLSNCVAFGERFQRQPYFYITGGDPILHPNFWEFLALLKEHNIQFSIFGNPFHINEEICTRLKNLGCENYQLSIDGTRQTHDWFRRAGSFDCTLSKIRCIKNSGLCSVIMTTVSRANIHEVPEIIDTVVEYGVDVYSFARYCPTGSETSNGISPSEYRDFLRICDEKFRFYESQNCATYFDRKDHLWTLYDYENGNFTIPNDSKHGVIYSGCNCGNAHLTILPNCDVYACRRVLNSKVGNALDNNLSDLWLNELEKFRDYDKFAKCSRCELLGFCRGCPAVASGSCGGDFYAPDPQCWKMLKEI